jgi:hypothetical protein
MGGGGGSQCCNTTSVSTVRYADYIEVKHKDFLNTMLAKRNVAIQSSPYVDYVDINVDDAFFGAGYAISSFPALYDMFGKFLAGLDIDTLWKQLFEDTINSSEVKNLITAEGALLDDEIETNSLPRLQAGMRDINSVMSSTFIVAKSMLEDTRTKAIAKFSSELKYRLIDTVQNRWIAHLDWNRGVIASYAEIMKLYFAAKTDVDEANYSMEARDRLWPFTVLEYEKGGLGALQGAVSSLGSKDVAGSNTASKVLGGALTGGAMGAMIFGTKTGAGLAGLGGPAGIAIGAGIGIAGALLG